MKLTNFCIKIAVRVFDFIEVGSQNDDNTRDYDAHKKTQHFPIKKKLL